jgi:hypothetical protein
VVRSSVREVCAATDATRHARAARRDARERRMRAHSCARDALGAGRRSPRERNHLVSHDPRFGRSKVFFDDETSCERRLLY